MPAWDGLHTVCRRPRCIQTGTQYCRNLIWIVPAEGSGVCTSNFLRHAGRDPPGLRPFVFQLVGPAFIESMSDSQRLRLRMLAARADRPRKYMECVAWTRHHAPGPRHT